MKELELIFTAGRGTLTISIANPKDGLTLAEVQAAAAKMIPVLEASNGAPVTALQKAQIITTDVAPLA